jgi:hypothetical protein
MTRGANCVPNSDRMRYSEGTDGPDLARCIYGFGRSDTPKRHPKATLTLMRTQRDTQATPAGPCVFPLPLAPFEYYYYRDDTPEYPTTFPVELRFRGPLIRDYFVSALEKALGRHPLLRAVIDDTDRVPTWIADPHGAARIAWQPASMPMVATGGEYLDVRSVPGLRTWVQASQSSARVLLQFHHACCDGLAALQFVQDVLFFYKRAVGVDSPPLRRLDPQLLQRRGDLHDGTSADGSRIRRLGTAARDCYVTARIWSGILLNTPAPLATDSQRPGPALGAATRELFAFEIESLNASETACLHRAAVALDVTVNDLVMRDFLLTLDDWNARHATPAARLRILVPVNVRSRRDLRLPAANRIGFGFVTSTATHRQDPQQLLDAVRRDTRRIKNWKLPMYFLAGVTLARGIPTILDWALSRDRSFATAVLSNVGRFLPEASLTRAERWRCGELELERVAGVPPLRRLTRAGMIVLEYAGETVLCLRCDPHLFTADETRELLGMIARRVRKTLRGEP